MGRRRDEDKLAVTREQLLADQSTQANRSHVDDDGVVINDLAVRYFRIDPDFFWIRKVEVRANETMLTTQLRENEANIVRRFNAL